MMIFKEDEFDYYKYLVKFSKLLKSHLKSKSSKKIDVDIDDDVCKADSNGEIYSFGALFIVYVDGNETAKKYVGFYYNISDWNDNPNFKNKKDFEQRFENAMEEALKDFNFKNIQNTDKPYITFGPEHDDFVWYEVR